MNKQEMWGCIATAPKMYFTKIQKIMKNLKDVQEIFNGTQKKLVEAGGLKSEEAAELLRHIERFNPKEYFEKLEKNNIKFVSVDDENYPEKLIPFDHKPYFLFYKGKLPDENATAVAMVGARACSNYGRNMAKKIGKELSERGVQVISGMARGVDTYSQLGAIEGGMSTYAVLGSGVDICYPVENIELYGNIINNGGIISEYPPGSSPEGWHFPQRNRIISGLADKIVVIEARENSGSLITVEWALEQGGDVMAVPGRVDDKLSQGCNRLIKSGAGIVTNVDDILSDLGYNAYYEQKKEKAKEKILEKDFLMLYSELGLQPKSIYELIETTGIVYEKIVTMLLKLQLEGLIEQPYENYFSIKNT